MAQVHFKREITWNMVQVNHRCPCKVNPHPRVRDTMSDSYLDRTVTLKTALKISGLRISNAFCDRSKRIFEKRTIESLDKHKSYSVYVHHSNALRYLVGFRSILKDKYRSVLKNGSS